MSKENIRDQTLSFESSWDRCRCVTQGGKMPFWHLWHKLLTDENIFFFIANVFQTKSQLITWNVKVKLLGDV